jgi:hypothetical protein
MSEKEEFYWCLKHKRVEQKGHCSQTWTMGPYDSEQAARSYAERAEERDQAWEDADEEWESGSSS